MRKRGSGVRGEFLLPLFSTTWVTPSHLWQGLSSASPPSLRLARGGCRVCRMPSGGETEHNLACLRTSSDGGQG
uniref:Putative secreted protein n=1 Tax=Ixodes ricinus TaxID=34613 RepID=A0A6B0U1G8_IXORI